MYADTSHVACFFSSAGRGAIHSDHLGQGHPGLSGDVCAAGGASESEQRRTETQRSRRVWAEQIRLNRPRFVLFLLEPETLDPARFFFCLIACFLF